jgi:membrane AbrB-like protein
VRIVLRQIRLNARLRWLVLALVSILVAALFDVLRLPAALLLGPLVVAATMAACNAACVVPAPLFRLAQGVIGMLVARALTLDILPELIKDWPIFLLGILSVIAASSALGWLLARWQVLPGSTAIWGAAPGAATAMVVMAGSFGADTRLVAFMQYLRVFVVVIVATLVARYWIGQAPDAVQAVVWFPPLDAVALAGTLLTVVVGARLGQWLRIPAGALLVPMILGAILGNLGVITIALPLWLLAPIYMLIGWQVGSRFDRPILLHAAKALPGLLAAIAALVGVCAGFSALLVAWAGIDPLTAYLAVSPGGIDSVAIIGTAGQADMPFVMAMQTARFLVVMAAGPWIARLVATSAARHGVVDASGESASPPPCPPS